MRGAPRVHTGADFAANAQRLSCGRGEHGWVSHIGTDAELANGNSDPAGVRVAGSREQNGTRQNRALQAQASFSAR